MEVDGDEAEDNEATESWEGQGQTAHGRQEKQTWARRKTGAKTQTCTKGNITAKIEK